MPKKILLLGDSIRIGYAKYVRLAFEDVAEIFYPEENCMHTTNIIRNLCDWKESKSWSDDIDLVHWNAGIWDSLIMIDGKPLIKIDVYKENIGRISDMINMLFPLAKVIFATSTPVREELFTTYKMYNHNTEKYNKVACESVIAHGGSISDLYSLLRDVPAEFHSDRTHFYTKAATELITNHTVGIIEKEMGIKAKKLDFDALFN